MRLLLPIVNCYLQSLPEIRVFTTKHVNQCIRVGFMSSLELEVNACSVMSAYKALLGTFVLLTAGDFFMVPNHGRDQRVAAMNAGDLGTLSLG